MRSFHAEHPAVTGDALGGGRAPDGRSSYAILADQVAGRRRVLDLGCGDGVLLELLAAAPDRRLAGVDLSPHSLALARRRPALAGTALAQARAQRLPFSDGAFDACVSHLALMLMGDADKVVAETARVLVPGGVLACAVGGGAVGGEAYDVGPLAPAAVAALRADFLTGAKSLASADGRVPCGFRVHIATARRAA
ncbi:class I SAM-dependent methyltransferase [Streptomyces sp. NPDC057197]|uniref:class I SAM-dependent methyltransferase n=1 Tax=Streptomyces sp. NPDC057197 TaxID=3346045 RepID=UPI00362B3B3F